MKAEINLRIGCACSRCGTPLEGKKSPDGHHSDGTWRDYEIIVEPCEMCLSAERIKAAEKMPLSELAMAIHHKTFWGKEPTDAK